MVQQLPTVGEFLELPQFDKPDFDVRGRRLNAAPTGAGRRAIAERRTPEAAFADTDGAAEGEPSLDGRHDRRRDPAPAAAGHHPKLAFASPRTAGGTVGELVHAAMSYDAPRRHVPLGRPRRGERGGEFVCPRSRLVGHFEMMSAGNTENPPSRPTKH